MEFPANSKLLTTIALINRKKIQEDEKSEIKYSTWLNLLNAVI